MPLDFSSAYSLNEGLSGKESTCQAGHMDSIPRLGRSPEEGNDSPLKYSCLGNLVDRGSQKSWHDWQTKHSIIQTGAKILDII